MLSAISCLFFLGLISFGSSAEIRWCVKGLDEIAKCTDLKTNVTAKNYPAEIINAVNCIVGRDNYECLEKIESDEADLVSLDAGTAYYASINFVSALLAAERYGPDGTGADVTYSVAVVPKSSSLRSASQLRTAKLCSSGVGDIAGWTLPLSQLAEDGILDITECNVNVKTAAKFFSAMCAPGALNSYHNPFGDNPVSTCQLCGSSGIDWCTYQDMYAGGGGAMKCLRDAGGEVAFLSSKDLDYLTTGHFGKNPAYPPEKYELLCSQGGRQPIGKQAICNWGVTPADVIVTSGAKSYDTQRMYREFLERLSVDFPPLPDGGNTDTVVIVVEDDNTTVVTAAPTTQAPSSKKRFTLFNSDAYGLNALVSSAASRLVQETRDGYAYNNGEKFQAKLDLLQACAVSSLRMCVVSEYEMDKCEQMLLALKSKNLKPHLDCIMDTTTRNCMQKIADDDADIIVLDAGDVYEAGRYYNLVPIANENYGDTGNYYYAVAAARKTESQLTLFNLIARNSCHGSMRSASGWIYPVLSLMETGQIKPESCEAIKKVGELFRQSCVPGILDEEYNRAGTNPTNLCENCAAGGMDKCQRNTRELYYGDSGAFRCLVEMGGDIAYVRHMTPRDNTDGRNADHWARNRRSDDYELLCKNGRRASITDWNNCYLAKVPARAVVTAAYKTDVEKRIFWNLLNYAQQFYSSDSNPYFNMFDSGVDQDDLLFSDSTVRLVEIHPDNQTYQNYLGRTFLKAVNTLNQFDCSSHSVLNHFSIMLILPFYVYMYMF